MSLPPASAVHRPAMAVQPSLPANSCQASEMCRPHSCLRLPTSLLSSASPLVSLRRQIGTAEPPAKALVYRNNAAGWGNRVQAMASALLLAVATGRTLHLQHGLFYKYYGDSDELARLSWRAPEDLAARVSSKRGCPVLRKRAVRAHLEHMAGAIAASPCHVVGVNERHATLAHPPADTASAHAVSEAPCPFRRLGFHLDWQWDLGVNPHHAPHLCTLFGSCSSFVRQAMLTQYLLQSPRQAFLEEVERAKQEQGFYNYTHRVAIQVRTYQDESPQYAKAALRGIHACCRSHLEALGLPPGDTWIFFTSDSPPLVRGAAQRFRKYGHVATRPPVRLKDTHTGREAGGGVSGTMLEWHLLGEGSVLITTYSTFGAFAGLRRWPLVKVLLAPLQKSGPCPSMPNAAYPSWYDDHWSNTSREAAEVSNGMRLHGCQA
eukprot:gene2309-3153_t